MRDKVFRKRTHNRKFSEEDILKIRETYKTGTVTYKQLSEQWQVSPLSISKIITRKTYYEIGG